LRQQEGELFRRCAEINANEVQQGVKLASEAAVGSKKLFRQCISPIIIFLCL